MDLVDIANFVNNNIERLGKSPEEFARLLKLMSEVDSAAAAK